MKSSFFKQNTTRTLGAFLLASFFSAIFVRCDTLSLTAPLNTPSLTSATPAPSIPTGTLTSRNVSGTLKRPPYHVAAEPGVQLCAITGGAYASTSYLVFSLEPNAFDTNFIAVPDWDTSSAPRVAPDYRGGCFAGARKSTTTGSAISRFDPSTGDLDWTVQINPPSSAFSNAIMTGLTSDASGNVYASGYYTAVSGYNRAWTQKYSIDGKQEYSQTLSSTTANFSPTVIGADSQSNVYLAGMYGSNLYLTQFNANGGQVWYLNPSLFTATSLSVNSAFQLMLVGYKQSSNPSIYQGVFTEYDSYGNLLISQTAWAYPDSARTFDSSQPFLVRLNNDGTFYVGASVLAGGCTPTCPLADEYLQTFPYVAKYSATGSLIWSRGFQPSGAQNSRLLDLSVDSAGYLIASGINDTDKTVFQVYFAP